MIILHTYDSHIFNIKMWILKMCNTKNMVFFPLFFTWQIALKAWNFFSSSVIARASGSVLTNCLIGKITPLNCVAVLHSSSYIIPKLICK